MALEARGNCRVEVDGSGATQRYLGPERFMSQAEVESEISSVCEQLTRANGWVIVAIRVRVRKAVTPTAVVVP